MTLGTIEAVRDRVGWLFFAGLTTNVTECELFPVETP